MSAPMPRTLGLLPALGSGLTDLSRGGQLERLLAYDLRQYAQVYGRIYYFSYFAEHLEEFTDDPLLRGRVTVLPRRRGWPPRLYALALPLVYARHIRQCDALRVMQFTGVIPALIARALFGVPFAVTYGYHYARIARLAGSRVKPWVLALLERIAFPAAAGVIVTSEELERALAGRPRPPRLIVRFPNGVDTRVFAPPPGRGTAASPPLVLYVGRLEPEKNLFRLIDALARIEGSARLRLVGDGSLRAALERHAAERGVTAEFAGVVPHPRLPAEFARAAVFVLPSLSEGHPKALLEAMSCAIPCAVSDCTGMRAIAEPDRTALFFGPTDVDGMAQAIGRLLADRELARRLGAAARRVVSERFEADRLLREEVQFVLSIGARPDTAERLTESSGGTVGRKAFLQLLAQLVFGALGFAGSVVVGRWMGPEPLGIIGYALGLVGLFGIASDLGISQAHLQRVAVAAEAEIRRCAGAFLFLKSLLLLLMLALLGAYLLLHPAAATSGPAGLAVLGLMVGAFLLTSLGQVPLITFRARAQTAILGVAAVAGAFLRFGWTLVVAVASLGVVALGAGYLAEAAATLGVGFFLFRQRYRIAAPDPETLRRYIRYALPLAIVVPLAMAESYLDRVLLGHFASVRELGFYVAVQGLVALPYFVSKSAMTVFYPSVAQSWAADRPEELRRRFVQVTRALLLVSVPIAVVLLVFAESLVTLLWGEEFRPAARILRVLALLPVLMALARPYSNVLYAIERQRTLPAISVVSFLVLLLASFSLIPSDLFGVRLFGLGGVGAAAAAVLLLATTGAQEALVVHRGIGLGFPIRILPYLVAGLGMGVVSRWLASAWDAAWPFNVGVGLLVGAVVYAGILWGLRELRGEDVRRLVDAVHPFRLVEYFRSEVRG